MKQVETLNNLLVYENSYSVKFINDYLSKNNLDGLRIYRPFEDNPILDFSFLLEIENLSELSIFYFDTIDFSFLYDVKKLKKISLQTLFSEIDFSKLSQLDTLSIQWNKKYIKNISFLTNLSTLFVNGFNEKDLNQFKNLNYLKFLSIKNSKCISLFGIEGLSNLEGLYLGGGKKLDDVSNLQNLKKIKYLFFDLCPNIDNLDILGNINSLQILEILDCKKVKTISFVGSLNNLKQLSILGSTTINDFNSFEINNIELLFIDYKKYDMIDKKNNQGQRKSFLNLVGEKF